MNYDSVETEVSKNIYIINHSGAGYLRAILNFEVSFDLRESILKIFCLHHDAIISLTITDHVKVLGNLFKGGLGL